MCGISLVLAREDGAARGLLSDGRLAQDVEKRLRQRGPDHFGVLERSVGPVSGSESEHWQLRICSAVLHLRGEALTPQPIEDARGNILCWNGEVFGYRDADGVSVDIEHGNDTKWLSELLQEQSEKSSTAEELTERVVGVLRRIHGPFAFAWLHAASQRLFFGHDRFGRRSLLFDAGSLNALVTALAASSGSEPVDISDLKRLVLSSVAVDHQEEFHLAFDEVPSNGIFVLDLSSQRLNFHVHESFRSTSEDRDIPMISDRYDCGLSRLPVELNTPLDRAAQGLLTALSNAVGVRVRTIPTNSTKSPRVGVLFSGGLDSVVLAALTHFHVEDPDEPIDLLNVCFDSASKFRSPDRLAAQVSHRELCQLFPTRQWRLICVNEVYDNVLDQQNEILSLLRPCNTHMDFNIGAAFWFLARGQGSLSTASESILGGDSLRELNGFLTQNRVSIEQLEAEAAVQALDLFSTVESGFCPAAKCRRKLKPGCTLGLCRLCCLKVQKCLSKLHGAEGQQRVNEHEAAARKKQLISLVSVEGEDEDRARRVDMLVDLWRAHWSSPSTSICRVHRSKKGNEDEEKAVDSRPQTAKPSEASSAYRTTARVLLVGIGADEQLGGYGRHKVAFLKGGSDGLRNELARDMQRIWKRNLGRDDRCISAHGREARFPFLDEAVVQFIASLPLDCVCDFDKARGEGDKRVLRVAAAMLGLVNCAGLAKRAIQFGTRIAKHANVAAFGSNRQASGDAAIVLLTRSRDGEEDDEE